MFKLAVGLVVAVAGVAAMAAESAGQTLVYTGSIDNAGDRDEFRFCAVGGDAIAAALASPKPGDPAPLGADVVLLDESGAPLASFTHTWRAPRTGLYSARIVPGGAGGDYRLSILLNGGGESVDPTDLSISESGSPDPVGAGELVTYTITVANAGPGTANYATMIDPLPIGTTFVSAAWTAPEENWDCTVPAPGSNGKIECTNKCFEPGGSVTFTFVAKVAFCAGDLLLTNLVTVYSTGQDEDPGDNVASVTSSVLDPRTCDDGSFCTVGDACAPGTLLAENFDGVAPRTLPPGWTSTLVIGPIGAVGWRTGTGVVDTAPNSAFVLDASDLRDAVLDSPTIRILSTSARLIFRNRYDLEPLQDGGVLEMKIGSGPFLDIEVAGGRFESGGYNATIRHEQNSPIADRPAWTGISDGWVLTVVDLPQVAVGQDVILRWRMATDRALGTVGQFIDSIVVTGPDVCAPGAATACDDNDPCTSDSCDVLDGCRHAVFSCEDGNPCTDDRCDAAVSCVHTNNSAGCDDHDVCTQRDTCVAGACIGVDPLSCSPGDACQSAACDEALGCLTATANFDTTGFSADRVDGRDVAVIARSWNSCPGDARYDPTANLDRSGVCVDLLDFHLFMSAFGHTCSP